jgi:hypothetical protein
MARKASQSAVPAPLLTFERAARLFRLLHLLAAGPQTRGQLLRRLAVGDRGFYRDLQVLRQIKIDITLSEGRYSLEGPVEHATARLPFPDPGLTLGEAEQLARGRSPAHRKLARQVRAIRGGARL